MGLLLHTSSVLHWPVKPLKEKSCLKHEQARTMHAPYTGHNFGMMHSGAGSDAYGDHSCLMGSYATPRCVCVCMCMYAFSTLL